MSKVLSEFWSHDHYKKALVFVDSSTQCYFVECYDVYLSGLKIVETLSFPGKTLQFVEDVAENYTLGRMNVQAS